MDKQMTSLNNTVTDHTSQFDAKNHRMQRILENDEKNRVELHNKIEKSSPIFANTKVTSCSSVLMSNGMTAVCMPFPQNHR